MLERDGPISGERPLVEALQCRPQVDSMTTHHNSNVATYNPENCFDFVLILLYPELVLNTLSWGLGFRV